MARCAIAAAGFLLAGPFRGTLLGQDAGDGKAPSPSTEPAGALARKAREELQTLQRKLRDLESRSARSRKEAESRVRELAFERQVAERSVQALNDKVAALEKAHGAKRDETAKLEKEIERLQHELSGLNDPLSQYLDKVQEHVDKGIPWKLEARAGAIQKARQSFSGESSDLVRALAEARAVQEKEETLGRVVEASSIVLEIGDQKQAVPAFHLGLVAVCLVSDDGRLAGFVQKGQKVEEQLQPASDPAVAEGYKAILDILHRRLTPRLVELRIPNLTTGSEDSK
jgi:predicted RNase H-like nuclease (RuvC/YqgF family)